MCEIHDDFSHCNLCIPMLCSFCIWRCECEKENFPISKYHNVFDTFYGVYGYVFQNKWKQNIAVLSGTICDVASDFVVIYKDLSQNLAIGC